MSPLENLQYADNPITDKRIWLAPSFELLSKEVVAGGSYQGNESYGRFHLASGPKNGSPYNTTPISF